MDPGGVTSSTLAGGSRALPEENQFESFDIDPSRLIDGTNVLAVEIHQGSRDSGDISMAARLIAERPSDASPLVLFATGIVRVKARARDAAGNWSALNAAEFLVDIEAASPANLAVSEIHYHPDDGDAEFIEIQNVGTRPVDLRGVRLDFGARFTFPESAPLLEPGGLSCWSGTVRYSRRIMARKCRWAASSTARSITPANGSSCWIAAADCWRTFPIRTRRRGRRVRTWAATASCSQARIAGRTRACREIGVRALNPAAIRDQVTR